jgi:hypothetical protein
MGVNYTLPGVIADMVECTLEAPCWILGLTQDEIGYMFPISDWKVFCTAEPDECKAMYQSGALAYEDSASGDQCKEISDAPEAAQAYYESTYDYSTWTKVNHTCVYGQLAGQTEDHYEEASDSIDRFFIPLLCSLHFSRPTQHPGTLLCSISAPFPLFSMFPSAGGSALLLPAVPSTKFNNPRGPSKHNSSLLKQPKVDISSVFELKIRVEYDASDLIKSKIGKAL